MTRRWPSRCCARPRSGTRGTSGSTTCWGGLEKQSRGDEAIRFYTAARRDPARDGPRSGPCPGEARDRDEAIAVFRDLRGLRPGNARTSRLPGRGARRLAGRARPRRRSKPPWSRDARRSGSSQLTHLPTASWAISPPRHGPVRRGHRLLPQGHRTRPEVRPGPLQPGRCAAVKGQLDEAIACFRKAIELDPKYASPRRPGPCAAGKGQLDEAIACFQEGHRTRPEVRHAHFNLGYALASRASSTRPSPATARPSSSTRNTPWPGGLRSSLARLDAERPTDGSRPG